MRVDAFTPSDAPEVAALVAHTLRESNAADYPPEEIERLVRGHTPERIREMFREGPGFVAREDGIVTGAARLAPSWEKPGEEWWLRTVFVLPERQGYGVGRALVERLEACAGERGGRVLRLGASKTAHEFYRRLGYRDTCPECDEDGLFRMEKTI